VGIEVRVYLAIDGEDGNFLWTFSSKPWRFHHFSSLRVFFPPKQGIEHALGNIY